MEPQFGKRLGRLGVIDALGRLFLTFSKSILQALTSLGMLARIFRHPTVYLNHGIPQH